MKRWIKTIRFWLLLWLGNIVIYRAFRYFLEWRQLECREWVTQTHLLITWITPIFLLGLAIWRARENKEDGKARKWLTVGVWLYGVFAVGMVFVVIICCALVQNTTEVKLNDGNYEILVTKGGLGEIEYVYYAEPVTIFARRRFEWDEQRYADSLSRIYDTEFVYVGDSPYGDPQFSSSDYYNNIVTVYGIDRPEIWEDLSYIITSQRLQQEWDKYFTHGEELVLFRHDFYSVSRNTERRTPVYAVVVYEDKLEETAKDITAFIRNECTNALRADGEPLYENVNGSISLLFKEKDGTEYVGTRNIPYGTKGGAYVYGADVTEEEILGQLVKAFEDEREEGRNEGIQLGRSEGRDIVNRLIQCLIKDGRGEEILTVVSNEAYQGRVLQEYGLR